MQATFLDMLLAPIMSTVAASKLVTCYGELWIEKGCMDFTKHHPIKQGQDLTLAILSRLHLLLVHLKLFLIDGLFIGFRVSKKSN